MSGQTHIDDWIDFPTPETEESKYAAWFFMLHRLPAMLQVNFEPWIKKYKLFCTYNGKRYRVTGASRLGDIWLTSKQHQDTGYEHRVSVDECSEWGPEWAQKEVPKDEYGYCPKCGAPGVLRERRPHGDDICRFNHKYPSKDALDTPPNKKD